MNTTIKPTLFFATVALLASLLCACNVNINGDSNGKKVEGTGDLIEKTIQIDKFTAMNIEGQAEIKVTYGTTQSVKVRAQENILELLDFTVTNEKLTIGTKSNYSIKNSKGIFIEIVTPNAITSYDISGAGEVTVSGKPQQDLNIQIAGAADFDTNDLEVENVSIDIAGAADCKVKAVKTLNVSIAGTGSVAYKGNPTVSKSIAGIGSVKKVEE